MYDPETANLLRSAPELPGLDPESLPQLLTSHYSKIVSIRMGGEDYEEEGQDWELDTLADAYELIVSISNEHETRRPAAFVAASARQIIARREELLGLDNDPLQNIGRDRLSPKLASALLFLCSEQYADAFEAASDIDLGTDHQTIHSQILTQHIVDLSKGNLPAIVNRGNNWRDQFDQLDEGVEVLATQAMMDHIARGIELLAHGVVGAFTDQIDEDFVSPRSYFETVKNLSVVNRSIGEGLRVEASYPGIYHLASLLISTYDGISESALTNLLPPRGADIEFWSSWIKYRANKFPYIWPNHRQALDQGFHQVGRSAVLVLPTGAGKTTVSSIKIAGTLAQGKKVIFLAPTHALVEQLTSDLRDMFPNDLLGASISSDFDLLFQVATVLPEIEVMTPERCLAMLSFSPGSFEDVGLLVFDECHLLSPESGKIRRSLDSMLCLLAFNKIVPEGDLLFLSAMVENGREFSEWIAKLTNRECLSIDLLWKPSRQARGVVIYDKDDLDTIRQNSSAVQARLDDEAGQAARSVRAAASRELNLHPKAIWGLQHNWLDTENNQAICTFTQLISEKVTLSGGLDGGAIYVKPNVNAVAAKIAALSAGKGLKTIIFVNQKSHAISTAKAISKQLDIEVLATEDEELLWNALDVEVGGLRHSVLNSPSVAVPHNASMLKLERDLAERMYRREGGAQVIVATPTLAQGLNLPAQLAVLAGDKRSDTDSDEGGRELLEAHELLNAAARAGRAGHLANGIVLLIPEPVLYMEADQPLNNNVVQKLQSIIPEDDRCVEISDPLTSVLDRISNGEILDRDVTYMVNRLSTLPKAESEEETLFHLSKSFAAFRAAQNEAQEEFSALLEGLKELVDGQAEDEIDEQLLVLSSQSGLSISVITRLTNSIHEKEGDLPVSIHEWILWLFDWLKSDNDSMDILLYEVRGSILGATGRPKNGELSSEVLDDLLAGVLAWVSGQPLNVIDEALGGEPDAENASITKQVCPRARELVSSVLPRGLSFVMGLITRIVADLNPYEEQENLSEEVVDALSPGLRLGYDTPEKLQFSFRNPDVLSRVAMHQAFDKAEG